MRALSAFASSLHSGFGGRFPVLAARATALQPRLLSIDAGRAHAGALTPWAGKLASFAAEG
jgi:hypothetical protein